MTRTRASARAAGRKWENDIAAALREHSWPHAERRVLAGARDRGDITGVPRVVIEAKNERKITLSSYVDEANAEAENDNADIGVAWVKRRGRASAADGYVVMDGSTFMELLKAAGY